MYSSGEESNPDSFWRRVDKHPSPPPRWTRDGVLQQQQQQQQHKPILFWFILAFFSSF